MDKASSTCAADTELDPEGMWDVIEYAPLDDIGSGRPQGATSHFIATLTEVVGETEASRAENMVVAKFEDEEKMVKTFWVHETHARDWKLNLTYVMHRAKIMGDVAHVNAYGMLAEAPISYLWKGDEEEEKAAGTSNTADS